MAHSRVVSDHWGHLSTYSSPLSQTSDEIGLTPEQRARLEELQTEFLERAASARELVDAQRAQLREEMERLRSEREEAVAELRAMLTEEQGAAASECGSRTASWPPTLPSEIQESIETTELQERRWYLSPALFP